MTMHELLLNQHSVNIIQQSQLVLQKSAMNGFAMPQTPNLQCPLQMSTLNPMTGQLFVSTISTPLVPTIYSMNTSHHIPVLPPIMTATGYNPVYNNSVHGFALNPTTAPLPTTNTVQSQIRSKHKNHSQYECRALFPENDSLPFHSL